MSITRERETPRFAGCRCGSSVLEIGRFLTEQLTAGKWWRRFRAGVNILAGL
ncbi:MAG: hypothetical protein ACLP0J_08785 [Solirubrobacteraceae bacterium]